MDERKYPSGTVSVRLDEYSDIIARLAVAERELENMKLSHCKLERENKDLIEDKEELFNQVEELLKERLSWRMDDGK